MAVSDKVFDIKVLRHGSGWEAVHVQVKQWCCPNGYSPQDYMIVLTADAITPEESDAYIDELIEQLQRLKRKARRKLQYLRGHSRPLSGLLHAGAADTQGCAAGRPPAG